MSAGMLAVRAGLVRTPYHIGASGSNVVRSAIQTHTIANTGTISEPNLRV
ncbi:MAG: hypothetical protein JWQ87_3920 [Candidatus Sulfotelmatobacter sp.]|nr:hypothetical protein [Candidatus Sulfotelmatobacter sp.]